MMDDRLEQRISALEEQLQTLQRMVFQELPSWKSRCELAESMADGDHLIADRLEKLYWEEF